jgi:hypothetical protein
MDTLKTTFQSALNSPAAKKLRTLEQARLARVTAKNTVRTEKLTKLVHTLDAAAKAEFAEFAKAQAESLKAQADDLVEISKIFQDVVDE